MFDLAAPVEMSPNLQSMHVAVLMLSLLSRGSTVGLSDYKSINPRLLRNIDMNSLFTSPSPV
jgi:hypothetical protein